MNKKIMKSLLVLFLAVSLTACGKTSQANNATQDTIMHESTENTQAETDTTNEETKETVVETPEPNVPEETKETEAPKAENDESTPAPTASPEPAATSKPEATAKPTTAPTETPKETATPKPTATPKATEAPKNTGNNSGNTSTSTDSGNGGTTSATPTPASAHTCTFDAGVVTTAATCGKEGVKTFTCTQCRKTKTETIPATEKHNYVKHEWSTEPICVRGGVYFWNCSCGAGWTEQVPATGIHTDDGGVIVWQANCGQEGKISHHCSVCGVLMYEEVIPITGSHSFVTEYSEWVEEPDLGMNGAKTRWVTTYCTTCNYVSYNEQEEIYY